MLTLATAASLSGIGLHTGQTATVRLVPATEPGLRFARVDLPGAPLLLPSLEAVARTVHATTLSSDGVEVGTAEHLLAALWTAGVNSCRIELDGPEVPILDGSALPWSCLIEQAGLVEVPRSAAPASWGLAHPVWLTDQNSSMIGLPSDGLRLTVAVDFPAIPQGRQLLDLEVDAASFRRELAPARTFTLEAWLEPLRAQGLIKGGSVDNAVVFGPHGASSPPRLPDELARHKALDLLGDIALLFAATGSSLRAHLIVVRGGHELHRQWMRQATRQGCLVPLQKFKV